MPQQQPPPSTVSDMAGLLDILHLVASIQAACFSPFLHYGMGVSALIWIGPGALLWMLCYGELLRCGPMFPFLAAWLVACFVQTMFLRDKRQHSKYVGYPLLGALLRLPERLGRGAEAWLVIGAGVYFYQFHEHFGNFFLLGGASILVKEMIDAGRDRQLAIRRRDGEIDAFQRFGRNRSW